MGAPLALNDFPPLHFPRFAVRCAGYSGAWRGSRAYLARIGDCVSCHTAPGGKPFSGGLSDGDARDIAAFLATLRGAGA